MQNLKHTIAWVVAFVAFAWCAYEWAFVDDGPAYFAAEWRRVASVAVFSVAGGLLVAVIMVLPTPARHRVGATVFGVCGLLAIAGCIWSVWQLFRFGDLVRQTPILWAVTAVEVAMCMLVGSLSFRLWRRFKREVRRGVA
jgi:hypothetical protein